jgi:hypothetical protein
MNTVVSPKLDNLDTKVFPAMMQMITGYWVSGCLYVVAKLGVADLLKNGPVDIAYLSKTLSVNEDALYRVLRALCGVGVFKELENKQFEQTPFSDALRTEIPGSMRSLTIMLGEEHYKVWGHLLESVKSGNRAFEAVYGMPVFEYFKQNPESSEIFNQAMTGFASNVHRAVISNYNFSGFKKIVDVGGGHGALLAAILENTPNLNGVLFDLPHVIQGASIPKSLQERFTTATGDFFESIYAGGDAYILSTVIHDWDDALSLKILKNIYQAMPEKGTLLLVENVVESDNQASVGKFLDINMLLMTQGGRERTSEEYRVLYQQAGFELKRVILAPSGVSILEGVKITP